MSKFLDYDGLEYYNEKIQLEMGEVTYKEVLATPTWVDNSYIKKADGDVATSSTNKIAVISLGSAKKVRFLGLITVSDSYSSGYAFYDSNDTPIKVFGWDYGVAANAAKEYLVAIPENAVSLKITSWKSRSDNLPILVDDFYCYLLEGDSIMGEINILDTKIDGKSQNYVLDRSLNSSGSLVVSSGAIVTDFIPATPSAAVVWNHRFPTNMFSYCLCAYDSNKQFISGQYWTCQPQYTRSFNLTNIQNIAYVRATCSALAGNPSISISGSVAWTRQEGADGLSPKVEDAMSSIAEIKAKQTYINSGIRNGSAANESNANYVSFPQMLSMRDAKFIEVRAPFTISSGSTIVWQVCFADATSEGKPYSQATNKQLYDPYNNTTGDVLVIEKPTGYETFMVACVECLSDGTVVSRRVADATDFSVNYIHSQTLLDLRRTNVGTIELGGRGATWQSRTIFLKKNTAYKIELPDMRWSIPTMDNGTSIFQLSHNDGSSNVDINLTNSATYTNRYTIYAEDALSYSIGLRASIGTIVVINITELPNRMIDEFEFDKAKLLVNAARHHLTSNSSKDFQLLEITDIHRETRALNHAIRYTEFFSTIDGMAICGDIVGSHANEPASISAFQQELAKCSKPFYIVVGNHDVGNWDNVAIGASHSQVYEWYIKPMVDSGILASGEYTVNLPYWYHDISTYKVRIIGLYEYDSDLALADNEYWTPVEYDATAEELQYNHTYTVGDVIKCGNYVDSCFRCTSAVTSGSNFYTNTEKIPHYKIPRSCEVYRQTQAQWFLDTLATTPANYGVIILKHYRLGNTSVAQPDQMFSMSNITGSGPEGAYMNDWMPDAINAFVTGTSFTRKVQFWGDANYMNTLNDDSINYAYEISKDFSQKNSGAYYLGSLAGHRHKDLVFKHPTYPQWQIRPCCAKTDSANNEGSDIRRYYEEPSSASDSLTIISFAPNRLALVKIGVNVTMNAERRDFEVIDTSASN